MKTEVILGLSVGIAAMICVVLGGIAEAVIFYRRYRRRRALENDRKQSLAETEAITCVKVSPV